MSGALLLLCKSNSADEQLRAVGEGRAGVCEASQRALSPHHRGGWASAVTAAENPREI